MKAVAVEAVEQKPSVCSLTNCNTKRVDIMAILTGAGVVDTGGALWVWAGVGRVMRTRAVERWVTRYYSQYRSVGE